MLLVVFFLFGHIAGHSLVHCYSNKSEGDVNLALITSNCNGAEKSDQKVNAIVTSKWIVDRLNVLGVFKTLNVGLTAYNACDIDDYFEAFFDVWRRSTKKHFLGAITDKQVSDEVERFSDTLKLSLKQVSADLSYMIRSTVHLLSALEWTENVTAFVPNEKLVNELFEFAKNNSICIRKYWILKGNTTYAYGEEEGPLIVFGNNNQITNFLANNEHLQDAEIVITPIDGLLVLDIPENAYIILPSLIPLTDSTEIVNLIPVHLIFELAQPILSYTEFLRTFLKIHCNETQYKIKCVKNMRMQFSTTDTRYTDEMILKILKIELLRNNFLYEIYRVENESEDFFKMGYNFKQPLRKMFTYNIFDDNLVNLYDLPPMNSSMKICHEDLKECQSSCQNFWVKKQNINVGFENPLEFRSEPFVLVFVAIAAVGVLVNLIILTFICVCICRKDVLEGNPTTTIFLLLTVLLMYCSVLPFCIRINADNEKVLCLLKSLWSSLSICGGLSVILARCILLATVTKEIAYMSHIPGSVQSFLTLFIFGVQSALSLQPMNDCRRIFEGSSFIYLMSYNVLLLLMILCLCPMIFKSQRNYKEGKYFSISAVLIVLCWCFWISCYKVLNNSWRDLLICFATISTASILQGVILVSRTYLMMVSSVRHKMRNSLPSGNERNGVLDIYRADARIFFRVWERKPRKENFKREYTTVSFDDYLIKQKPLSTTIWILTQVYDCVNIAAINAISVARAGTTTDLDDDIYNYPTLPRDEELNFEIQTNSSFPLNKVTRF